MDTNVVAISTQGIFLDSMVQPTGAVVTQEDQHWSRC